MRLDRYAAEKKLREQYELTRDAFAMAALTGYLANPNRALDESWSHTAKEAYEMADAMMAERL